MGAFCHFPFTFQGKQYTSCVDKVVLTSSNGTNVTSYARMCAVTADLDKDGKWGYCLDYSQCYFPFTYNNIEYRDCISSELSPRMCATTSEFDSDRRWMHCPVVCKGEPEINGDVDERRSLRNHGRHNESGLCEFESYYSKTTNEQLHVFSHAPCRTVYYCLGNGRMSRRVERENIISCRQDGTFEYKATCLPMVILTKLTI